MADEKIDRRKPQKKIAFRSKKQARMFARLGPAYEVFLAKPENKYCKILSPVCTNIATCVNHTDGRGANTENEEDWEASCTPCNGWIEEHHQWAFENGHKKQRHRKK